MFKFNVLFTIFIVGLVSCVSAATPPACVLACVNEEKEPADVAAVCAASAAQECLYTACTSEEHSDAVNYFDDICKSHGHSVADAFKPSGTVAHASSKPTGYTPTASNSKPTSTSSGSASASSSASSAGKLNGVAAPVYALAGAAMAFYAFA